MVIFSSNTIYVKGECFFEVQLCYIVAQSLEFELLTLNICSREFTHRVKSVSMAKFTSQEVSALKGGGNAVRICSFTGIHPSNVTSNLFLFFFFEKNVTFPC